MQIFSRVTGRVPIFFPTRHWGPQVFPPFKGGTMALRTSVGGSESGCAFLARTPVRQIVFAVTVPAVVDVLSADVCGLTSACFINDVGARDITTMNISFTVVSMVRTINFLCNRNSNGCVSQVLKTGRIRGTGGVTSANFILDFLAKLLVTVFKRLFLAPLYVLLNSAPAVRPCTRHCLNVVLLNTPFVAASLALGGRVHFRNGTVCTVGKVVSKILLGLVLTPLLVLCFTVNVANTTVTALVDRYFNYTVLF